MDLASYLRRVGERPGAFGRRIGAKPSTVSGWLNSPQRGPSRAMLAKIEAVTGGKVTARDFAPREQSHDSVTAASHDPANISQAAE